MNRRRRWFGRWMLLAAAMPLFQTAGCLPDLLATATSNAVFLPPELSDEILNDRTKLEDRLRQYLGESFPSQYEKQIKAYFKALLQLESQPVSPEQ